MSQWKSRLLEQGIQLFENGCPSQPKSDQVEQQLYEQIGRLKMELEWLKKKLPLSVDRKRSMIEPQHPHLSLNRQCDLLGLNRATYYYQPVPESAFNLEVMRRIELVEK